MSCLNCSQCPGDQQSQANEPESPTLVGRQLVIASAGFFLLPIALAIVGSALATRWNPGIQLVGAIVGMGLGLACVKVVGCVLARMRKNSFQ